MKIGDLVKDKELSYIAGIVVNTDHYRSDGYHNLVKVKIFGHPYPIDYAVSRLEIVSAAKKTLDKE